MPSQTIRWGIIGTGFIAGEFARGLKSVPQAQLLGIASRKVANAQTFSQIFQVPRFYDSCEELVQDPDINVVYIGTPNYTHKDLSILCLEAGKPILCEKPFTVNAQEAREVIAVARRQQLFCMEAMWMRFMPLIQQVKALIEQGEIGEIKMLTADFSYVVNGNSSSHFHTLEQGGGVLLDRGIYGLSLAYSLLGEPSKILTQANLSENGVDEQSSMLLNYSSGALAVLAQSLCSQSSNQAMIMGTKGKITIDELFIMPEKILLTKFPEAAANAFPSPLVPLSAKQKIVAKVKQNSLVRRLYIALSSLLKSEMVTVKPLAGNGYNYEASEVVRCLQNGQLESKIMPLDETLKIMEAMDQIRSQWH
ncbi:MAG: Gfo/Idh/MocA family oxidoreductase [Cyanobacteria bacterium P01_G01_bin.67]